MKKRILSTFLTLAMIFAFIPTFALPVSAADVTVDGLTYTLADNRTATVTGREATETSIEIPASITYGGVNYAVTAIGNKAFYESAITSIEIPASVTSISNNSFTSCTSLETVTFTPNSQLEIIGAGSFYRCAIKCIEIPASVTSIEKSAFDRCTSLETVTFADNSILNSIGGNAFQETALTGIEIPASVKTIGDLALYSCNSLENITVNAANTNYKDIDGVLFDKAGTQLMLYPAQKAETSYEIPDTVTTIGAYSFYKCTFLKTVIVTENSKLTTIDAQAFRIFPTDMKIYYTPNSAAETALRTYCGDSFDEKCVPTLVLEDNANYDIPAGSLGAAITEIDASSAVSGGASPYTFSLESAPTWLSINSATGVI